MTVQEDNATSEIVVPEVTVTGHQQETRETTVMKEAAGNRSCRVGKLDEPAIPQQEETNGAETGGRQKRVCRAPKQQMN
ncbi:hypothetical protein ACO22_03477 [Paracoccidioides brasiliensis]|uniref:Uncharacterized protein n=1 Tax=Paracoccidioides brasiliensis TaxID=121759 RepID=A0A1D2JFS0_PARBR|nr:hypothetical protein ACO22_03477 [Paracoccidioides brasiliensis]